MRPNKHNHRKSEPIKTTLSATFSTRLHLGVSTEISLARRR